MGVMENHTKDIILILMVDIYRITKDLCSIAYMVEGIIGEIFIVGLRL
jgi:hypothetical protein